MAYTQIPAFTKINTLDNDTEFVIVVDGVEYLVTFKTLSDKFGNTPELLASIEAEIEALRNIVDALPTENPAAPIALKISDTPTIDGIYKPTETGVYPNAGGLEYDPEEGITYFIRTAGVWTKDVTPINFTPTGVVEEGNTQAVSGGEVYENINTPFTILSKVGLKIDEMSQVVMLNQFLFQQDKYLSPANGVNNGVGYGVTDYIPCQPNNIYLWRGRLNAGRVSIEYDANYNPIGVVVNENSGLVYEKEFTTSQDARYLRLCSYLEPITDPMTDFIPSDETVGLFIYNTAEGFNEVDFYNNIKPTNDINENQKGAVSGKEIYSFIKSLDYLNFKIPNYNGFWISEDAIPAKDYTSSYFETLVNEYNDVINNYDDDYISATISVKDKDQSGEFDINEIIIERKDNDRNIEQLTILIFSGQHGSEYANPIVTLEFIKKLLNSDEDIFVYLRETFRWVILPIINPWGYKNAQRSNSRGVNLNRNFPIGWKPQGIPGGFGDYSGEYPLSEKEAQVVKSVLDENPNYIIAIDGHAYSGWEDYPYNLFWSESYNFSSMHSINSLTLKLSRYARNNSVYIPSSNKQLLTRTNAFDFDRPKNGLLTEYLYSYNKSALSFLIELPMRYFGVPKSQGSSELVTYSLISYVNIIATLLESKSFVIN